MWRKTKKRSKRVKTVTTPSLLRGRLPGPRVPSWTLLSCLTLVVLFLVLGSQVLIGAPDHAQEKDKEKPYALIAGTVWGPDDHPIYGVRVKIRRAGDKPKKVRWEMTPTTTASSRSVCLRANPTTSFGPT